MSLLPREHGAYGQLAFPLATSLAVAGAALPALATAVAAVAGFLAHEPLLVLLGRRGGRARRELGRRARVWLVVSGVIALAAGLAALWLAPPSTRWSFALPLLPAAFFGSAVAAGREKTTAGEIAAALAFALLAIPVCLVAGAPASSAFAVGAAFAAILVAATLAVRVIVLRVRGGGDAHAVAVGQSAALIWVSAASLALVVLTVRGQLPWVAPGAALPGLAAALTLALSPPPPARLRAVGWTLIATSAAAAVILAGGA